MKGMSEHEGKLLGDDQRPIDASIPSTTEEGKIALKRAALK